MRKNLQQVLASWVRNSAKGAPGDSIWTDGESIFSYNTCIVTPLTSMDPKAPTYVFNTTKYSVTTTRQQNELRVARHNERTGVDSPGDLFDSGYSVFPQSRIAEVEDLPRGATPDDLRNRYHGGPFPIT